MNRFRSRLITSLYQSYRRSHSMYTDRFGNTICEVVDTNPVDIQNIVSTTAKGKAVLLKNIDVISVENYNKYVPHEMLLAKYQCNPNVYLIRNWSKCPELCDGKFIAGGVNILVSHEGSNYGILMKDKTKNYLTCPGGTATPLDIVVGTNVGIRELYEETSGLDSLDGINLSHMKLNELCKFHFKSNFFDISGIPDTYTMNMWNTSVDNNSGTISMYLSELFSKKNQCDEDCYKLSYDNHDETEFVYALNLGCDLLTKPTVTLCDVLSVFQHEDRTIIKKYPHPVTYLHSALCQIHQFNYHGKINTKTPSVISNVTDYNFPNNLVKIELAI